MTWVKKVSPEWQPQEHPGIIVGDVVDFPGPIEKLLEEGAIILCTKEGIELSTFETTGKITDREMAEFKAWTEMKKNEKMQEHLEKEIKDTKAELDLAAKVKAEKVSKTSTEGTKEQAAEELKEKRKAWAAKMAAARAAKKSEAEKVVA
jgi:glucosamine 6-phosphate synthetase-like amidotransferase/phosphosugar isomerase protein